MKRPAAKFKTEKAPPPERCMECEERELEERYTFEIELSRLESASWTVAERRSLGMTAWNTLRRRPKTRAELIRSLLMVHVIEAR